jgi:Putative transposase.
MMKDYYQQSMRALQLAGMSQPTQKGYTRSVRMLVDYYGKTPDLITEQELVENRNVFIRYKKQHSNRWRTMSLGVMEFLRRFLQHVLPTGFMKVRYYGFLNPCSSVPLDKIRTLIEMACGSEIVCREPKLKPMSPATCPHCGGELKYMYSRVLIVKEQQNYRSFRPVKGSILPICPNPCRKYLVPVRHSSILLEAIP